ncbi:phytoene synthase [Pilobolus umbonatus]|nr:phytoene synthase [Pilobolus umbonatus]
MLTYMEVHLYYTVPVLFLLFYLLKPFHSSNDTLKYYFLLFMAVSTASVWDNYIVYHKAWSYCPTCVVAVIGYVPLEEYMFFGIMTLMTVAFTNLVMRWKIPSFYLRPQTPFLQTILVRFVPMVGLLTIAYKAWNLAIPGKSLFYGGCILWYVCPVLALLWYGAGEYMIRRFPSVLLSITLPTLYLCWVDKVAISAGTWDISLRTSTGKMVVPHLPVEEFMFFLLINVVLVFATCAVDRAQAIVYLYKNRSLHTDPTLVDTMKDLVWAFFLPDQMFTQGPIDDLNVTWDILQTSSKSFHSASAVFSVEARQDLGILYGFCRATDDLCDDESVPVEYRKQQLALVHQFVKEVFSLKVNTPMMIQWKNYTDKLPASCISSFKTFVRLRPILEVDAVEELLNGYQFDLERRVVKTEADLRYYSACVASSVGEMCTRILLNADPGNDKSGIDWTIERARDMGLVLQYTNIARDIVTDSKELGRCYLPNEWLSSTDLSTIQSGQARSLGDKRLYELAMKLVNRAEALMSTANKGIDALPANSQGGVRAACHVYTAIGRVLKDNPGVYPDRAHIKKFRRTAIALASVYDLYHPLKYIKRGGRQGKIRSFTVE